MDAEEFRAAQAARWRAADPLLPEPVRRSGEPVRVPGGVGWPRFIEVDPHSVAATRGPLRQHSLVAHVCGDEPARALGLLLDRWAERLGAPGDQDSAAAVLWPSRDTAPVLALARRGFRTGVGVAVASTGRAAPVKVDGLEIRPVTADDVELAAELDLRIVRYDSQFGGIDELPATMARLVEEFAGHARQDPPTAWLAVRNGRPVGMCAVHRPGGQRWIGALSSVGPAGYLSSMYVDPAERGAGIGAALHAHADAALHAAGAVLTLLHHESANPLSTPFWYAHGYRPLWTTWLRRPALIG
jgi:GNAT superfamily N-acetyltransferase